MENYKNIKSYKKKKEKEKEQEGCECEYSHSEYLSSTQKKKKGTQIVRIGLVQA